MGKDYYNILGVGKTATQDEIKQAFRKKAHVYHPDKQGGDEAKFKELNEAYQVLGDPGKRSQYDQFGPAFEQAQAHGGFSGFNGFRDASGYANGFNVNMDDLGDIFGGIGDMFGFGGGGRRGGRRKGADLRLEMKLSFAEAVSGVEREVAFEKRVTCAHCHGNTAEPGTPIETCRVCGGSGRVLRVQRTILGNMQVQMACDNCGGEGKTYAKKCTRCGGSGVTRERVSLRVAVPAGIDDGETIRLTGQGEAGERGSPAGDAYITVRVAADKRFERHGYDIRTTAAVTFAQAALGATIDVETVDGPVALKVPAGTQSGTEFRLRGKGMPRLRERGRGDHFVTVAVTTPTGLSRKQKELLRELDL